MDPIPPRGQSGTPHSLPVRDLPDLPEVVKLVPVPMIPDSVIAGQMKDIATAAAVAEGVQAIKEQSLPPIQEGMPTDWGKLKYDAAKILLSAFTTVLMLLTMMLLAYVAGKLGVPVPVIPAPQ